MTVVRPSGAAFDATEFRRALGSFATGVTVVTTCGVDGEAIGLTANSFNSVSLTPPLVLWSLARSAQSLPAFEASGRFVVHVLAGHQEALSQRFARRGTDKFAGLEFDRGIGDAPLLRGCAARFQCRTAFTYDGGDHVIFVGEVVEFDRSDAPPLVFHGGQYAWAVEKGPQPGQLAGSFADDFLGYLLGRGHSQFYRQLKNHMHVAGVEDDEHIVLGALTTRGELSVRGLQSFVTHLLSTDLHRVLAALESRGYITSSRRDGEAHYALAPAGREFSLRVIAAAKAYESHMIERFGEDDIVALKSLLRKLVTLTRPEAEHKR